MIIYDFYHFHISNSNIATHDADSVPALHHVDAVLLVNNNIQLSQGFKQEVTLQNQITLKGQISALLNVVTFPLESKWQT